MSARWTLAIGGTIGGMFVLALGFIGPAAAAKNEHGSFSTLPAGQAMGLSLDGIAHLKRSGDGTRAMIHVRGLTPGATYAAHLHNAPCSVNEGGGHYKDNPAGPPVPPNELWLSSTANPQAGITANPGGVAHGYGSADWIARDDAQSIVIHYIPPGGTTAGGPKIACADLA
jgi:hypothetical protein